ncbi:hypothetical protein FEM48_Zijuj03G0093300 [Ziziphus jujuba var. spinosa]|uniref:Uncharacterized protein n=1 Tax=Ziziphus jujuba var. spinosa TaxID=714518 RepID=A0A978VPG8_ZIZJJ|nr:hypothetical protein FEM48_Zijuj03G0093300 [Ziziphus jujuba var. spinosa]
MLSVSSSSSSSWQALSRLGALSVPSHSHHRSSVPSPATHSQPLFHCSLTGFRDISPVTSPAKSDVVSFTKYVFPDRNTSKAEQFLLLSSCLDSILHAEHKRILQEMRADYFVSHRTENGQRKREGSPNPNGKVVGEGEDSESAINGIGSLEDEDTELSNLNAIQSFSQRLDRDLMLTSALNSDYLLTSSIYVDWKKASESNAIIFRRGYVTETQLSMMLGKHKKHKSGLRLKLWLKDYLLFEQSFQYDERTSDGPLGLDQLSDRDLPIWLAAQRAVFRYEVFLSPVGPRGRLLRKLLTWIGLIPPTPGTPFDVDRDANASVPNTRFVAVLFSLPSSFIVAVLNI